MHGVYSAQAKHRKKPPIFTEVIKYHSVSNLPDYQKDQEQK